MARVELAQHAIVQMRRSIVPLFLGAIAVAGLFYSSVQHGPLQLWLVCALVDVLRVMHFTSKQRRRLKERRFGPSEELRTALHSFSFAVVWGSLALVTGLYGDERSFWLSGMIVLAAVSFATVASASSRLMFTVTLVGLVTPLCAGVLIGVQHGSSIRILVAVFIATSVTLHESIHRAIVRAVCSNLDSRRLAEQLSQVLDIYDPLTLTLNRQGFRSWVAGHTVDYGGSSGSTLAIAVGNVERMSALNELYGARHADLMLCGLAERLMNTCGQEAAVVRISGDEFLIARLFNAATTSFDLAGVFDLVVAEPFVIDGQPISISLCVASVSGSPDRVDELVVDASTKVRTARGRRSQSLSESAQPVKDRRHLIDQLAYGLRTGQVRPWFQPIVEAHNQQIRSWEALVRWEHPERGVLGPDRFLDLAAIAGLSSAITDCVLRHSVSFVKALEAAGMSSIAMVHVNVDATDLHREGFADVVGRMLNDNRVGRGQIVLEVTEQSILHFDDSVAVNLQGLAALGVPLAVDDFGTGYSSLSHLLDLKAASIKIDRRFVAGLSDHYESRTLVRGVIGMANGLGLSTVAEGVETAAQAEILEQLGCDDLQGYLISPALSHDRALRFAAEFAGGAALAPKGMSFAAPTGMALAAPVPSAPVA